LDFPIDALYSHPKLRQAGALQDTLIATKRLGQLHNLGHPQPFRAFASSRETLPQGLPSDVQTMSAGFSPDTSAAAFPPKSTFAFTLWVKPSKFQNAFHCPILSASVDCQQIFNCGL
jgi:hypothetical protein